MFQLKQGWVRKVQLWTIQKTLGGVEAFRGGGGIQILPVIRFHKSYANYQKPKSAQIRPYNSLFNKIYWGSSQILPILGGGGQVHKFCQSSEGVGGAQILMVKIETSPLPVMFFEWSIKVFFFFFFFQIW